ncbi:MAG TPA: hypothetical protein VNW72_14875 [Chthoniobacterales bacterium]|jgi:hypothetical protein|nr:hypothetical protein [Chthoniobacterales bacterium]
MPDTVSSEEILDHLINAVRTVPLTEKPFDHLQLCAVFPPSCYAQIIANLPETRYYGELNHSDARLPSGRSARRKLELRTAQLRKLPEPQRKIWSAIASAFKAPELEAVYKERFAAALECRFQKPARNLKLHPAGILLRDVGGYKISVHCDTFRKAITTQYYLPRDASQLHLGTTFHEKKQDGTFVEVKTLEFAPNSGYGFAVVSDSWHSVRQMKNEDGTRDSLMLIYYLDQGWLGEGVNSAKRFIQDLRCTLTPAI